MCGVNCRVQNVEVWVVGKKIDWGFQPYSGSRKLLCLHCFFNLCWPCRLFIPLTLSQSVPWLTLRMTLSYRILSVPFERCIDLDLAYPALCIDCWLIELYILSVALPFIVFYLFHRALSHSILSFCHAFTINCICSTLFRSLIVCPAFWYGPCHLSFAIRFGSDG